MGNFQYFFPSEFCQHGAYLSGDGTPVYTSAQERKTRTCNCLKNGIRDCKCNRIYHQPDCDIGWDSHRNRHYFGYDLYMLTASDSENDLPVFPFLSPASRHDSHVFLYNWFSMKKMLPEANVTKLLLDSAHDAMPYYDYCKKTISHLLLISTGNAEDRQSIKMIFL